MDLPFILKTCIILSHFERIWTKSLNGEIDDFINKLLRSDKFDELAEKVAEKAARKIFDLDHIRISHNIKTKKEKPPYKSKPKSLRERDDSSEENIKEGPTEMVTTEMVQLRDIEKTNLQKELIIKQTFSKDIPATKEQLRLKFKNLSKASKHPKTNNETGLHNSKIDFEITERFKKKDKQLKSRFEKVNNHRKDTQMKNKSGMSSENEKISNEEINEEKENKVKSDDKENYSNSEKGSEEKNRSDPVYLEEDNESIEMKHNASNGSNDSQNQILSLERDNNTLSKEKQISNDDSVRNINNRAEDSSETEKETDSNEKNLEDVRKSYSMTTRRLIIRREGDKLIAFENQSDYKEYEEKVANQKVERKDIVI